jgi:serine/threonine protein kinase
MYTPGFAGPELYEKNGSLGPWTDIYSIGASIFASMSGHAPQPADARLLNDKMASKYRDLSDTYSEELLGVVEWCLRLDPLARPQSVFALQKALLERTPTEPKKSLVRSLKRFFRSFIPRAFRPRDPVSTISMNTR